MRIPLDYYRILGVPIQADADQLHQAYQDRMLQLPRREYSDIAITARKQLLQQAYEILSHEDKRSIYNAEFLSPVTPESQQEGEQWTASIEIKAEQFLGALLILQELGEYEMVLKLAQPYLDNRSSISVDKGRLGNPQMVRADLILSVSLAYLEMSRELWQQRQYEKASSVGQIGQELLLKEGLFPSVRGEIQADLYRLRPYRILELLSLGENHAFERKKGLQLLKDMLHERGGIDGTGEDQSGLNVEDFLRFVHQLRAYLTAVEQQELFEAESRRPSAVATYLCAYAFLADGFAHSKPVLVVRSKELLRRLSRRQDVHLETAICALLLGQTDTACRTLEMSQEQETLHFIRENSQGSPDLLPGLCLYTERWLHNEVFPHFRDLALQRSSLRDYFANDQVQQYLEGLPWEQEVPYSPFDRWKNIEEKSVSSPPSMPQNPLDAVASEIKTSRVSYSTTQPIIPQGTKVSSSPEKPSQPKERITPSKPPGEGKARPKGKKATSSSPIFTQRLLLWGAGVVGLLIFFWVGIKIVQGIAGWFNPRPRFSAHDQGLIITKGVTEGAGDVSAIIAEATVSDKVLSPEVGRKVIQLWFDRKKTAFGQSYDVEGLKTILLEPELTRFSRVGLSLKKAKIYRLYETRIDQVKVKYNSAKPNQGSVEAQVMETVKTIRNEQLDASQSGTSKLKVRYDLIRKNNQWFIQRIRVI